MQRYGGTVDKFTGDGIMAVFGAPVALEDHAVRACLAALGVQEEAKRLAVDVQDRDGVDLQLRVGLNSGQVIAGEIGSGAFGYTAVGEQVGMAQRMESVAPPGGVMLSESTARLVEGAAVLGEPEMVHIKGADEPVPARRLLGMADAASRPAAVRSRRLVGRSWELAAIDGLVGPLRSSGHGACGRRGGTAGHRQEPTGRVRRRALASRRGVEVFSDLLRVARQPISRSMSWRGCCARPPASRGLDDAAARARVRAQVPDADPEDLLLLDDLLGIARPRCGAADDRSGCAAAAVDRAGQCRVAGPHQTRRSMSSRMRTGSMRSASRCWPTSSP